MVLGEGEVMATAMHKSCHCVGTAPEARRVLNHVKERKSNCAWHAECLIEALLCLSVNRRTMYPV